MPKVSGVAPLALRLQWRASRSSGGRGTRGRAHGTGVGSQACWEAKVGVAGVVGLWHVSRATVR